MTLYDYKQWLASASCRNPVYVFTATSIQTDSSGNPNAIVGTVSSAGAAAQPAVAPTTGNPTGTAAVAAVPPLASTPMTWNMNGQALVNNRAFDLVQNNSIESITAPTGS